MGENFNVKHWKHTTCTQTDVSLWIQKKHPTGLPLYSLGILYSSSIALCKTLLLPFIIKHFSNTLSSASFCVPPRFWPWPSWAFAADWFWQGTLLLLFPKVQESGSPGFLDITQTFESNMLHSCLNYYSQTGRVYSSCCGQPFFSDII